LGTRLGDRKKKWGRGRGDKLLPGVKRRKKVRGLGWGEYKLVQEKKKSEKRIVGGGEKRGQGATPGARD